MRTEVATAIGPMVGEVVAVQLVDHDRPLIGVLAYLFERNGENVWTLRSGQTGRAPQIMEHRLRSVSTAKP